MADFVTTNPIPQVRAPESRVTPGDVAQPYHELGNLLDQAGERLSKDVAEPLAHQAGLKAVQTDAAGNITVDRPPVVGDAAIAYARGMKYGAVAQGEGEMRRTEIAMRQQYANDPEGYRRAAEAFRQEMIKKYTDAAGPEVGITMGKLADATITQSYRGLENEKRHLDLRRAESQMDAGIESAVNNLHVLARKGVTSGPEWQQETDKVRSLYQQKVDNPSLAYPPEKRDLDFQLLQGQLKGEGFLYHTDQIYQDPQLKNVLDRRDKAIEYAKSILTDQSVQLTPAQREAFYHKAMAEIRLNEGKRTQDINEVARAEHELKSSWILNIPSSALEVNQLGEAYERLGAHDRAAAFYAYASRKAVLDTQGQRTFGERTTDLMLLNNRGAAEGAYQFFIGKGYSPIAAAGIVGNLIHESALDPTTVHDRGIGLGIAGWNRERLTELQNFAASRGKAPTDLQTQLEFVDRELHGKEGATLLKLTSARTPEEAATAFVDYERPQGWQPGSPTTALGYLNRVALARQVAAFAGGAGTQPVTLGAVSPAQSLWEQQLASRSLKTDARSAWTTAMKEWDGKDKVVPSDETVTQIMYAARAANDQPLLEQIAIDYGRIRAVKEAGQQPATVRADVVASGRVLGAAGNLPLREQPLLKDLEEQHAAIVEGMKTNPIATTRARFPGKFADPGPLDISNDDKMVAGLRVRNGIAANGARAEGGGPVAALDKADLDMVKGALDHADPAAKARIFSNLANGLPDERVRNATLAKIGEGGKEHMTEVFAGSLLREAEPVARGIFNGMQAIKVDNRNDPLHEGSGAKLNWHTEMDKRFPVDAFSQQDRSDPAGAYHTMNNAIRYRYADLTATQGKPSDTLDTKRLQTAIDDVTGGFVEHNGHRIVAPQRGMNQDQYDRLIAGVSDGDLAGVTTLANEPVTGRYLRNQGKLERTGNGRYFVQLGTNPERPIYAYQGVADPELGGAHKFVLDLSGRPVPGREPAKYPVIGEYAP